MAGKCSFSVAPQEQKELEQIARIIFWGGDATVFPETKNIFYKWRMFFEIFLESVDRRTGSFLHLPFAGGTMEQPAKTMTILNVLQVSFFKKLKETFQQG